MLKSSPRESENVRRIAHPEAFAGQCGIHKQGIACAQGAEATVHVPKDVKHRLHSSHCFKKLRTSCVIIVAGRLVEDAIGWAMGHQHICVVWYS